MGSNQGRTQLSKTHPTCNYFFNDTPTFHHFPIQPSYYGTIKGLVCSFGQRPHDVIIPDNALTDTQTCAL